MSLQIFQASWSITWAWWGTVVVCWLVGFHHAVWSLPFDDSCAEAYGAIRSDLEASGTPIGPNDLMIAAVALTHDLVLVSHNEREFTRVVDLRLEDWE